ncbi:hypothetical protein [Sphingomonas sp. PB4P5]|uniref:hypothetical protein n=1 Tax=Parasphingomonas puruogangriensis TaxID=3096155 RepID=UPI002FCA95EE
MERDPECGRRHDGRHNDERDSDKAHRGVKGKSQSEHNNEKQTPNRPSACANNFCSGGHEGMMTLRNDVCNWALAEGPLLVLLAAYLLEQHVEDP